MNVGDKLTVANLNGNYAYTARGRTSSAFTDYVYTIGTASTIGNGVFYVNTVVERSTATIYVDKWIGGTWVNQWIYTSSGGQGELQYVPYMSEGYWRVSGLFNNGDGGWYAERSRNAMRRYGYKLRKIYSDCSGYPAAGGKLYASDANVGLICTY